MHLLLALGLSAGASPAVRTSWWTTAQARDALTRASPLYVVDRVAADEPVYVLRIGRAEARQLRPAGRARLVRGVRTWPRFVFSGTVPDEYSGRVFVRFAILPRGRPGPRHFALRGFRGPLPDRSQPTLPLRAAFYYAWFPEAWTQLSMFPYSRYEPALGYYDSADPDVIHRHIAALRYGKFAAAVYSWWGSATGTDGRFGLYLRTSRQTPLRWAVYYEQEGYGDPDVGQIRDDLEYIRDSYANQPAYLRLNGRFVVFVYQTNDSCSMAERWAQANAAVGAYVVLGVFPGYRNCVSQPEGWHQYGVDFASGEDDQPGYSFTIMPGFWRADEAAPRFARDLSRWRKNVRDMVASGRPLQLVTSFSEWGEGTAVESAREWASASGFGSYLDALHDDGVP
jgi:hypothetical protein